MNTVWKITKLVVADSLDGLTQVVVSAKWTVTATNEANGKPGIASLPGSTDLATPSASVFVPFEELTEELLVAWVHEQLGADMVAWYEARVRRDVDAQIGPVIVEAQPPWVASNE